LYGSRMEPTPDQPAIPFTRANAEGKVSDWQIERAKQLTQEFHDGIVDICASMLAKRWWKSQIFAALRPVLEKQGLKSDNYTLTCIMTKAKEQIREAAGKSKLDAKAEAVSFYEEIIRDESVDANVKIKAQERLDHILGIESKHDKVDPDETARKVREAIAVLEKAYSDTASNSN
jgi:DNA polymerase III gamma/tau subunit